MRQALAVCVLLSVVQCAARSEATMAEPELRIKAMFLFNFARFTTWPADVKPPFTFCVIGDDRLDRELQAVGQGRTVADLPIAVRYVPLPTQTSDCRVIYVGRAERNRTPQIVRSVAGKSVLVVSEYPDAGRQGATINFFMEDDRMRFSVNLAAAADAGVSLSSNLLRLARIAGNTK
ncbi:MAG TPA: YfiR family protein [Bryobacteraceae bacterium]|nr:YfiR family protein [Bryobacteraceae bacterium]